MYNRTVVWTIEVYMTPGKAGRENTARLRSDTRSSLWPECTRRPARPGAFFVDRDPTGLQVAGRSYRAGREEPLPSPGIRADMLAGSRPQPSIRTDEAVAVSLQEFGAQKEAVAGRLLPPKGVDLCILHR